VSSRNRYLSEQERREATVLYRSLEQCQEMVAAGTTDAAEIRGMMVAVLEGVPTLEIEYVSLVDAETLEAVEQVAGRVLVAVAARLGPARLIDNIVLEGPGQ
jgi:pantoate--beta-alanine ligase